MAENPRESNGYVAKVYEGERIIPARELTPDNGYTVGVDVAKTGRDRTAITLKLNVDVSDALTGLKALRREADKAARALREIEREIGIIPWEIVKTCEVPAGITVDIGVDVYGNGVSVPIEGPAKIVVLPVGDRE